MKQTKDGQVGPEGAGDETAGEPATSAGSGRMDGPAKLPVVVLTGFLGAGKTTLLKRWLTDAPATGRRLGIVMNEFGQENIDARLLGREDLPMLSVEGGCICCAPDNELERACRQLARSGACDVILLETSGVADPDSIIDVLTDPDLEARVALQAVVAVVDAAWWSGTEPDADLAERVLAKKQVQFAQVLCLSKCDLLDAAGRDRAQAELQAINPGAQVVRLPYGLPDLGTLLAAPPAAIEVSVEETPLSPGDHLHHRYQSVSWRFPVPVDRPALETFLRELNPREVVRSKGFVRLRHDPEKLHLFQSVFGQVVIEEFPAWPHPDPVAVFIGPALDAATFQARLRDLVFGAGARRPGLRLEPGVTAGGEGS